MNEKLRDAAWRAGARALRWGKRTGLLDPIEHALVNIAGRVVPPPRKELEISLPHDLRVVIPPAFARARTYAAGIYEPDVTAVWQRAVQAGATVADVGAFCGYYALLASRLAGPAGRVYAFEPHPRNYDYLLRNIHRNQADNVTAVPMAVTDGIHDRLALVAHHEADHHWVASDGSRSPTAVRATSLDRFFERAGWPSVDLIKMDIEGAEHDALKGMEELSRRNPRLRLLMEYDQANLSRFGADREHLAITLTGLGFTTGYVIERAGERFSIARDFPRGRSTYNLLLTRE